VKATFDAVSSRMRSDEVGFDLVEPLRTFCDEAHQADVKTFFEARAARFDGLAHSVATVVESIGQCATAFEKNRPGLDAFLSKY
jgi:hypothetical protein